MAGKGRSAFVWAAAAAAQQQPSRAHSPGVAASADKFWPETQFWAKVVTNSSAVAV